MVSLENFTNGKRMNNYSEKTDYGFYTQGNIGSILNDKTCQSETFKGGGICVNQRNHTEKVSTHFLEYATKKLDTSITQSELLPHYPNGVKNMILGPEENLTLDRVGYPSLYGTTTAFINKPELINNPDNNIGHEIQSYGLANSSGSRSLGQGRHSKIDMTPGQNIPNLKVKNINGNYISTPVPIESDLNLYQVGNWTKLPNNFISNFENSIEPSAYKTLPPGLPQ